MFPLVWGSEGIKPLFSWQQQSLFDCVGVFHVKVDDGQSLRNLTQKGNYPFLTPYSLATMTWFYE